MTATASSEGLHVSPELDEAASGKDGIISLRPASGTAKTERIPALEVAGKVYTMKAHPKLNESLRYINLYRTRGIRIAIDYMMDRLLGEGWQAALDFDGLTDEDVTALINAASKVMTGPLETPKGKQKNASSKSRG